MVLVERMVLLLIEMAPNNCMTEANLLLVCSVMNNDTACNWEMALTTFTRCSTR